MTKPLRFKPIVENIKIESCRYQVTKVIEGLEKSMVESNNNTARCLYEAQLQALNSMMIIVDIIGETDVGN